MANMLLVNLSANGIDLHEVDATASENRIFPPLALMRLAGRLIEMDCLDQIKYLDYNMFSYSGLNTIDDYDCFIHDKLFEYRDFCIDIIGVSITFSESYSFFELFAKHVKNIMPECVLICGGSLATNTLDAILQRNHEVDYVICGEGEEVLPLLVENIVNGKNENIIGVHHKGNIKVLPQGGFEMAPPVADINVNLRAYDLFDMEFYTKAASDSAHQNNEAHQRTFTIMASRGCPGGCTFCSVYTVAGRRTRWRSLDNIREEIMFLYERYGITQIIIIDSILTPKDLTLDFLNMLAGLPIAGVDIVLYSMSVNHTDFEILDAIAKLNVGTVAFAIESGNKKRQKQINKNVNLDKAVKLVAYAKSLGIKTSCNYMLGFPGETLEEMQETIDFCYKVKADWGFFYVVTPLPGTVMYKQFVELVGDIKDSPATMRKRTFDTDEISARDLTDLVYTTNLKYNFIDNHLIRDKLYAEAEILFRDFLNVFGFHIFGWDCLRRIYTLTDRLEEAEEVTKKIEYLMETNPKSKGFRKYMHLLDEEC